MSRLILMKVPITLMTSDSIDRFVLPAVEQPVLTDNPGADHDQTPLQFKSGFRLVEQERPEKAEHPLARIKT